MPAVGGPVRSIGPYAGWMRSAIVRFKYHGEWGRAAHFGPMIAEAIHDLPRGDLLVPVPLHPARLRHRGFNQSLLLAEQAALLLDMEVRDVLVRSRMTHPQVGLGADARAANVAGAFRAIPDAGVLGCDVVLMDDVITTGSTLAACAQALLLAGANSIAVATVAREL